MKEKIEKGERERRKKRREYEEEAKNKERRLREEREKEWRKKVLLIKRGTRANKNMELEMWIKKSIKNKNIKIVRAVSNKDAAKIFFVSEKEKDEAWEKRDRLREEEDMFIDRWLTIEEREDKYNLMEICRLKQEYKKKGIKLVTKMEEDYTGQGER